MDKDIQLKIKALHEYGVADALEVLKLVEKVHNFANPLFVKRTNFYAAYRAGGDVRMAYIARVRVLADLAKLKDMDHNKHVKFKVLKDLPVKIREKVLKDQTTLDDMTVLVAEAEAMDIVNNSLKSDQQKLPPGKGPKAKEDSMTALETKPGKTPKQKKKSEEGLRRKLPDEA